MSNLITGLSRSGPHSFAHSSSEEPVLLTEPQVCARLPGRAGKRMHPSTVSRLYTTRKRQFCSFRKPWKTRVFQGGSVEFLRQSSLSQHLVDKHVADLWINDSAGLVQKKVARQYCSARNLGRALRAWLTPSEGVDVPAGKAVRA